MAHLFISLRVTSKIYCTRCKNIEVNFIFFARLFISLRVNLEDILHSL